MELHILIILNKHLDGHTNKNNVVFNKVFGLFHIDLGWTKERTTYGQILYERQSL